MASGREAAISVDRLLHGQHLRFGRTYQGPTVTDFEVQPRKAIDRNRLEPPRRQLTSGGAAAALAILPNCKAFHPRASQGRSPAPPPLRRPGRLLPQLLVLSALRSVLPGKSPVGGNPLFGQVTKDGQGRCYTLSHQRACLGCMPTRLFIHKPFRAMGLRLHVGSV